jgi:hypothetical protein
MGNYFSRNRLLATPIFYEMMTEKEILSSTKIPAFC